MNLIVTALKQKLAPFGWSETLRRGGEQRGYAVSAVSARPPPPGHLPWGQLLSAAGLMRVPPWSDARAVLGVGRSVVFTAFHAACRPLQAEMQDIDSYLQKMGVRDPALRRRLETAVPFADQAALAGGGAGGPRKAVAPLNSAAHEAAAGRGVHGAPVLLACCDAGGGLGGMEALLAGLELPVFAVRVPDEEAADDPADVAEAAMLALKAARGLVPAASPLLVGGVGHGAVLAHEMALQLAAAAPGAPLALVLLEGCHSPRYPAALLSWLPPAQREEVCQVAAALYPVVAAAAGAAVPGVEAFAARLASLPGYDEQLDYVASFKPAEVRAWLAAAAAMMQCCLGESSGSRLLPKAAWLPTELRTLLALNIFGLHARPHCLQSQLRPLLLAFPCRRASRGGAAASPTCWTGWPTGRPWLGPTRPQTSSPAPCCCSPAREPLAQPPACSPAADRAASGAASRRWCSLRSWSSWRRVRAARWCGRCRPRCWRRCARRRRRRRRRPRRLRRRQGPAWR